MTIIDRDKPVVRVNRFSGCACPTELFWNDILLGTATAFFWRAGRNVYIVSNWHVFSGRRPLDRQPVHTDAAVPNRLKIEARRKNANQWCTLDIPVEIDSVPVWKQHSIYGKNVDVAILNIMDLQIYKRNMSFRELIRNLICINDLHFNECMALQIGLDLYVLGFPKGIKKTEQFPIWKRASIATEPDYMIGGLPSFLIDTATKEGMSGAPVIQMASSYPLTDGSYAMASSLSTNFVGIYSGRHVGEISDMQLGVVWKRSVIEDIIRNPSPGENHL